MASGRMFLGSIYVTCRCFGGSSTYFILVLTISCVRILGMIVLIYQECSLLFLIYPSGLLPHGLFPLLENQRIVCDPIYLGLLHRHNHRVPDYDNP